MPQMHLPIFPEGATSINPDLAFERRDGRITYFTGAGPFASHDVKDVASFKSVIAQLCDLGAAKQAQITRAFGVTKNTVVRALRSYREKGQAGFYAERRTRGAAVLVPSKLEQAQELLDQGREVGKVARSLDLKPNTLAKAVRDGRLHKPATTQDEPDDGAPPSSKSQRSVEDSAASMGMGATNEMERVAASLGQISSAPVQFKAAVDIPNGGVLLALPALLVLGLLRHTEEHFELPKGYYGLTSIFLLLAFMALARLKSIERLRYCAPGEHGKLLGLDRVPEVRTLRKKLRHLSHEGRPGQWSAELCAEWMKAFPEQATAFYIDGHVRVYHGKQTRLPRRYVSRQKLCLRACTDYWVNAMDGQPFFVVYQDVDPGMIQVLEKEILPRLERDAPNQPTEDDLKADPSLHRFALIFDREGYSPKLFRTLWERRIACLTYRKWPGDDWPEKEFTTQKVVLVSGNVIEMNLAERRVQLGSKPDERIEVREIRRLMPGGHQTSIISTNYRSNIGPVAAAMFARWCQENYFKYMGENFGIDRLVSYETEPLPGAIQVVNPEHRRLDREVRRQSAVLSRKTAEFGALDLANGGETTPKEMEAHLQRKAELHEEITLLQEDLKQLKQQRKATEKHVSLSDLPEEQRFRGLSVATKQLTDTIKMVAYRAETAMAHVLRERMPVSRADEARNLLRAIYRAEVDLLPDHDSNTLRVRLHHLANRSTSDAVSYLCQEMNATETVFPGTNLRLVYELVSGSEPSDGLDESTCNKVSVPEQNPRDQVV